MSGRRILDAAPGGVRLGFGCADVFRLPTRRARQRLLDAALHAGVTHFDVAPMYGFGRAEPEVGSFLRGRRERITVATKFGIGLTPAGQALGWVQGPIRMALQRSSSLRERARSEAPGPGQGHAGSLLYRPKRYDVATARASLDRSLRALGTDHVDLLLLHDPEPEHVRDGSIVAWLEEAQAAGRIGAWGLAGEAAPTLAAADALGADVPVLQLRDDVLAGPHAPGRDRDAALITFGTIGGAVAAIGAHLADEQRRARWREAVGADVADPERCAALVLRLALRRNATGRVLFGTVRPHRIAAAVDAARAGDGADLDAFETLVDAELRGGARAEAGAA